MDLIAAVIAGDFEAVDQLLTNGADPNVADAQYSDEQAQRLRRTAHQWGEDVAFARHPQNRLSGDFSRTDFRWPATDQSPAFQVLLTFC